MKRSLLHLIFSVVILSSFSACSQNATSQKAISPEAQKFMALRGDVTRGEAKFNTTCIACHGQGGKGVPNLGKDLVTSAFTKNLSDPELALFIEKGRPASDPANTTHIDMPPRGGNPSFIDQDLVDIVTYLRTLQK